MDVVDHLIERPGEPAPPGARCGLVTTADGIRLRWATFDAPRPRATVILLQGRAEYLEGYVETVRDLQARGLSVVAFDWRGQGGSERLLGDPRKGHVATLAAYDFDLDAVLRLVAAGFPKPWYVLAHSTGALVAIANATRLARDVRRMVLTAPFLGLGRMGPGETLARPLARLLRGVGLGRDWVPGGGATPIHVTPFATNFLTSDADRHARDAEFSWHHPEVAIGSPTVGWLAAAFDAIDRVFAPEALEAWRLPSLLVAAGDDRVVSNAAIDRFAARTATTDVLTIPGARHEILKERDRYREQFWAAFDAFVPWTESAPATPAEPEPVLDDERPDTPPSPGDVAAVASLTAVTALATVTPLRSDAMAIVTTTDVTSSAAEPGSEISPEPSSAPSAGVGEEPQDLLVQPRIAGGDDPATVDGAAAVPGGDDTAGALDHRDQRDDVVGLQPGLDHHVDEPRRDHAVGVAVDPVARQPDP